MGKKILVIDDNADDLMIIKRYLKEAGFSDIITAEDGTVGSSCPGGVNTYGVNIPMIGVKQIDNPDYRISSFNVMDRFSNTFAALESPETGFEYCCAMLRQRLSRGCRDCRTAAARAG